MLGGAASARAGGWALSSSGPTAVAVQGKLVLGESSGEAHEVILDLPAGFTPRAQLDGKPLAAQLNGARLTLRLPSGSHQFTITGE